MLSSVYCFSQSKIDTSRKTVSILPDIDAEPPGGQVGLINYISNSIHYPQTAIDSNVQGTVYIRTIINEDGSIGESKIIKGIGGGCNEEALRVIKSMPRWKPAETEGKPVKYSIVIPVKFILN
jgi:protein TonB